MDITPPAAEVFETMLFCLHAGHALQESHQLGRREHDGRRNNFRTAR